MRVFRAPHGFRSPFVARTARRLGYITCAWSAGVFLRELQLAYAGAASPVAGMFLAMVAVGHLVPARRPWLASAVATATAVSPAKAEVNPTAAHPKKARSVERKERFMPDA